MKTYIVPILLGITLCCSSCVFLINTAIYGTNCETCQVLDFWGEVHWCDEECLGMNGKEEMREECERYAEEYGMSCYCAIGEEDDDD